jgi:hypothetical protein
MATTLNAGTTTGTSLQITTDTSGAMNLQTSGTTAVSINTSQVVSLTNPLLPASGGTGVTTSTGTGSVVLSTSPTLVTPVLGNATASSVAVGTLTYTPANALFTAQSSATSYNQVIIQNSNTGTTASTDFIVNNSNSTDNTYYGDFGMNGSGFTGTGAFSQPNTVYLTSTSTDLAVGTTTANGIHFVVNNGAADAATINSSGVFSLGTPLAVASGGVGANTLAANNVLLGNGTSAVQTVAPSTSGNVLTSDGTTWVSASIQRGITAQAFTASGTFTPDANVTKVKVTLVSGGGGGGGGANSANVAGNGTSGGSSSFGTLLSQTGQNGGAGANNTGPTGGGANGGTPGGTYMINNVRYFLNLAGTITYSNGGAGGDGGNCQPVGGGGGAGGFSVVGYLTVTPGTAYTVTVGAGGTGGGANGGGATGGGAGTAGYVLVEW